MHYVCLCNTFYSMHAVTHTIIPSICGTLIVLVVFMVVLMIGFTLTLKLKKRMDRIRNVPGLDLQSPPLEPIYDEIASEVTVEYKLSHDNTVNDVIILSPNECYQAVRKSHTPCN